MERRLATTTKPGLRLRSFMSAHVIFKSHWDDLRMNVVYESKAPVVKFGMQNNHAIWHHIHINQKQGSCIVLRQFFQHQQQSKKRWNWASSNAWLSSFAFQLYWLFKCQYAKYIKIPYQCLIIDDCWLHHWSTWFWLRFHVFHHIIL